MNIIFIYTKPIDFDRAFVTLQIKCVTNEWKKQKLTFAIYSDHFHFEVYSLLSIHCLLHFNSHVFSVRCRFFCVFRSIIHSLLVHFARSFVRLLASSILLYVPFVRHCQMHKHILHSRCARRLCSIGAALFDFYKEIK